MTLLGHQDGTDFHSGISYLDLAAFIMQNGKNVNENLREFALSLNDLKSFFWNSEYGDDGRY